MLIEIQNYLCQIRGIEIFKPLVAKIWNFIRKCGLFTPITFDENLRKEWEELKSLLDEAMAQNENLAKVYQLMDGIIVELSKEVEMI